MGIERRAWLRGLALTATLAAANGCMFFRSLEELEAGGALSNDSGPAGDVVTVLPDGATVLPDGALVDAGSDALPTTDGNVRGCAAFDLPSETDGSFVRCVDFESAGNVRLSQSGATIGIEADDGPSAPNALVSRYPATASPAFTSASGSMDCDFVAKSFQLSVSLRREGNGSPLESLFGVRRGEVNAYLIYDRANQRLFFSEQDQRDGGTTNGPPQTELTNVDLSKWTRVDLTLDYVAGTYGLRAEGAGNEINNASLTWPVVNEMCRVWLSAEYYTDNPGSVSFHFDDVVARATY